MYIHPCSFTLTYPVLAGGDLFDSCQTRETGANLDAKSFCLGYRNKGVGSGIFFVFPEVCSLSDLANIADPDQVLRRTASGWTL